MARAFLRDGAKGLDLRQMATSRQERDYFRWLKLPFDPVVLKVPVWSQGADDRTLAYEDVALVLPSDVIQEISSRDLQNECFLVMDA